MAVCINAWIDQGRVGCGRRDFIVARVGPKWVTLLAVADLTSIVLPRIQFDAVMAARSTRTCDYARTRLANRIRAARVTFGVDTELVAGVLASLKKRAP